MADYTDAIIEVASDLEFVIDDGQLANAVDGLEGLEGETPEDAIQEIYSALGDGASKSSKEKLVEALNGKLELIQEIWDVHYADSLE